MKEPLTLRFGNIHAMIVILGRTRADDLIGLQVRAEAGAALAALLGRIDG